MTTPHEPSPGLPAAASLLLPAPLAATRQAWKLVGSGTLTWAALRVYDAALYAVGDTFYPDGVYSLAFHYLRELPAAQIVMASSMEMARLADPDATSLAAWTDALHALIPDVKNGDRLLAILDGEEGATFHFNGARCGEIHSPQFARAFAAIWLDERARSAALRASLLDAASA